MHDLVHDLATFVSGEFCFRLEGDNLHEIPQKVRHFSYIRMQCDVASKFDALYGAKNLHTLHRFVVQLADIVVDELCFSHSIAFQNWRTTQLASSSYWWDKLKRNATSDEWIKKSADTYYVCFGKRQRV
ncbi:hypothetical protein TorRG33x02_296430 [Trema orientale]|uniref:Uncharacterized protein n=1 Tax=Trema orientale TaxID=63057 RepID=A0A2P5C5R4_TREOI|nr:hypothetical protein TorRG33x02_296430 [Trema orientale]